MKVLLALVAFVYVAETVGAQTCMDASIAKRGVTTTVDAKTGITRKFDSRTGISDDFGFEGPHDDNRRQGDRH